METFPDSVITCVDTWEGSEEHDKKLKDGLYERFLCNTRKFGDRVKIKRGFSGVMLRQFPCESNFNFVYVDGSHYSRDALEDAILAWRLLEPGGIIFLMIIHGQWKEQL